MKAFCKNKWLVIFVLLAPSLLWLERERRLTTLIGTWQVLQGEAGLQTDPDGRYGLYDVFRPDGTGQEIFKEVATGKEAVVPFTYQLKGLWKLEIISDYTFCGTDVVRLGDPCLGSEILTQRVRSFPVAIGVDRNHMYINPSGKYRGKVTSYWARVR